jgi:hypothetical protein
MIALLFISWVIIVYVDNCKHWGCILKNNTCSGCGAIICKFCFALEAGATSIMQPTDQFYGDRSASIKDQFGNIWYVATHIEDLSSEELTKRMDEFMKKRKQEQI